MDCRDALERLSDYQDAALAATETAALEAHLLECAECAGAGRSLAAVRDGLRRLPPVTAPPELMARVREAVAREGGASPSISAGLAAPPGARSLFSRMITIQQYFGDKEHTADQLQCATYLLNRVNALLEEARLAGVYDGAIDKDTGYADFRKL